MLIETSTPKRAHIHLSRFCNLNCIHCYSESGPNSMQANKTLDVLRFLDHVSEQGYTTASFSGGEPLLYKDLTIVLGHAKSLGLTTNIVTNGTIASQVLLERISPLTDLLAVSLDGPEKIHNKLRNSATAFKTVMKNLPEFEKLNIPLGLIHTVTEDSISHLPWLVELCLKFGFSLLQLHPLGNVGNANKNNCKKLDGEFLFKVYLAHAWLKAKYSGALHIHIDLFNAEAVNQNPEQWNVVPNEYNGSNMLADIINPIVLRADGKLYPICHDMDSTFCLGDIKEKQNLSTLFEQYMTSKHEQFVSHCKRLWEQTYANLEWPYLNWYEVLERSHFSQ